MALTHGKNELEFGRLGFGGGYKDWPIHFYVLSLFGGGVNAIKNQYCQYPPMPALHPYNLSVTVPSMPHFNAETLKSVVENGIAGSQVTVEDMTGTHDHFQMTVVSDLFANKSLIDRQRMVFGVLGSAIGGPVHALTLKTHTCDEAAKIAKKCF